MALTERRKQPGLWTIAATAVTTFVVQLLLQLIASQLTLPHGTVTIGAPVPWGRQWAVSVEIANVDRKALQGLRLRIPSAAVDSNVRASQSIRVSRERMDVGSSASDVLVLSDVPSRQATSLLFSGLSSSEARQIAVLNADELRIGVLTDGRVGQTWVAMLAGPAIVALVAALMNVLLGMYLEARVGALYVRIADEEARAKQLNDRVDRESARMLRVEMKTARIRVLLHARLTDAMRELEFWRDTIRSQVYKAGGSKQEAKELLGEVTSTLKTYAAQGRIEPDYDTLLVLAGLLSSTDQPQEARGGVHAPTGGT